MQLRKNIMHECRGDQRRQKAVAIALYIKHCIGRNAMMNDFTFNKLHNLTGISTTTLKKYMPFLISEGWVTFTGKNNKHLVICKLASHRARRNFNIDFFDFSSFKGVLNSIRTLLAVMIQKRKDFIRRTIQTASNPSSAKEYKDARSILRRLVKDGAITSVHTCYNELGISLAKIARELCVCVKTAQNIIGMAIKSNILSKERHTERVFSPNYLVDGYTFYYNSCSYLVHANTYTIATGII